MADVKFAVNSGEVAMVATVAKSVLQIKAVANQRVKVLSISIMGKAQAGGTGAPAKVRLTQSTATFGTFTAATPHKINPSDQEVLQTICGSNATIEPTAPTDSGIWYEVSPQSGLVLQFTEATMPRIQGGTALNIEITDASTDTFTVTAVCEE